MTSLFLRGSGGLCSGTCISSGRFALVPSPLMSTSSHSAPSSLSSATGSNREDPIFGGILVCGASVAGVAFNVVTSMPCCSSGA
ncbi:hypothetical protein BDV25DRAFT_148272 [Aspergillus avenaceus]|uniref:Uncharacterized protein n=1 Tax=Aspergillus avenaceus TaxID=36643 RepID=A0A5N6U649_ASPAV|nr:hypothetical protein BDV25DRAFT_148272 [Aspergillus avenaceus]